MLGFVIVGGADKKISLEHQGHPCPRCKLQDSVQLTRSEKQLILMNKRVGKPNNMRVRYECAHCSWNGKTLPLYNIMLETEMMKETFDFDYPFTGPSN
jgi:Zn ribbon nucleic-acid-binding protein